MEKVKNYYILKKRNFLNASFTRQQGWIQLVSLGGAISVIFASQVSVGSQVSFWIVQNHGE